MPQLYAPTMQLPNDPNDLYQTARNFVEQSRGVTFSPFLSQNALMTQWNALLFTTQPQAHKTLFRCINIALRSFHPSIGRQLRSVPTIAFALNKAKSDKSDLTMPPASNAPLFKYCYYASIADTFGTDAVKSPLAGGELVLLGLRQSTSTLANKGLGAYDDKIIVIKGIGAARMADEFPACTEPGAQYAQRAAPKPGGKPGERVDDRYVGVKKNYLKDKFGKRTIPNNVGEDVDGDGILDAGRLTEGTYQYTEKQGGFLGDRAFRVGSTILRGKKITFVLGATQVAERDTDGDGVFTNADPSRIDNTRAGTTMYIHNGGSSLAEANTWSAGCQTIPKNFYKRFLQHIPVNTTFHYVLVNAVG